MLHFPLSSDNRKNHLVFTWWNSCTTSHTSKSRATPATIEERLASIREQLGTTCHANKNGSCVWIGILRILKAHWKFKDNFRILLKVQLCISSVNPVNRYHFRENMVCCDSPLTVIWNVFFSQENVTTIWYIFFLSLFRAPMAWMINSISHWTSQFFAQWGKSWGHLRITYSIQCTLERYLIIDKMQQRYFAWWIFSGSLVVIKYACRNRPACPTYPLPRYLGEFGARPPMKPLHPNSHSYHKHHIITLNYNTAPPIPRRTRVYVQLLAKCLHTDCNIPLHCKIIWLYHYPCVWAVGKIYLLYFTFKGAAMAEPKQKTTARIFSRVGCSDRNRRQSWIRGAGMLSLPSKKWLQMWILSRGISVAIFQEKLKRGNDPKDECKTSTVPGDVKAQ